ncbi:MAG: hypothetical protein WDM77_21905 [Steroidobacteraceae bacterium]
MTLASWGGGVGSAFLMSGSRFDLQLLVLLLVTACGSGAVGAFGSYLLAFCCFMIPAGLFPVAWLITRHDTLHPVLGGVAALWFIALLEQARRAAAGFEQTARLRFENEDLVLALRREKAAPRRPIPPNHGFWPRPATICASRCTR